jgi:DNA-binding FadR family transcriptional regulator
VWHSLGVHARTFTTLIKTGIDPHELVERHVPILEALRTGDPDAAARAVREHLEHFARVLLEERE